MLADYKRIVKGALLRPLISVIPKSKGIISVTFHNIEPVHYEWFEQVIELIDMKYGFVNPHDLLSGLCNSEESDEIKVLLTFDDGFYSNRVVAEKYLSRYSAKAIFFIAEGFVGLNLRDSIEYAKENIFPDSGVDEKNKELYQAMSWSDVAWLKERGHVIGAHTVTHCMLSKLATESARQDEIVGSADRISEITNQAITSFAFPFGHPSAIDRESFDLEKDIQSLVENNLQLPRFC